MQKSPLNYRTAFLLALAISLLMNMLFLIMFFFSQSTAKMDGHVQHIFRLDMTLLRIFFNFLVAFLLYLLNFNLLKHKWFSRKGRRIYSILTVLVCTAIISCICSLVHMKFDDFGPHPYRAIGGGMFRDYLIAIVVILSSQLIYLSNKQQQTALENERLQAEYMKTRFMALKNQVDPHFLFNSLNTLSSLIQTDADKAQEYVQQLSYVFRYTLQNKEIITLEEELKFTLAYCHLMQIRYGDNLQFIQNTDEKYYSYFIVPLSLQILVENAIKHNVVSNRQPLAITFSTSEKATIKISNPVQPKKDAESGESIGLSNLAERYRLLWSKEIAIRNAGGIFEVEIPLIA
ncbi:MAG: histidine kinase [Dysgonamonadaceae bacterium]|jgi:sensor histidine kinase YesM|nr:histidine kinase [Dysgonamonadaceae bacterium]